MAIETVQQYNPKHKLPVYTHISLPGHNDWSVGDKYDVRIQDKERQKEKGGSGPYNYIHEAVLIAKEQMKYGDVSRIMLGFDAHTTSKSEAEERIFPDIEDMDEDTEVVVLVFMRLDRVKDFVTSGMDVIEPGFDKEQAEGNGRSTDTE
jgi:hypothetical protein